MGNLGRAHVSLSKRDEWTEKRLMEDRYVSMNRAPTLTLILR